MKIAAYTLPLVLVLAPLGCGDDGTTSDTDASTTDASTSETETTAGTTDTTDATDATTDTTTDTGGETEFAMTIWPAIINDTTCSCHVGGSGGLVMGSDAATAYAALVGVASVGAPGLTRVVAGDASSSYLINKLRGTQLDVGGAGGQMPLSGGPLADADIAAIEAWINAGAN